MIKISSAQFFLYFLVLITCISTNLLPINSSFSIQKAHALESSNVKLLTPAESMTLIRENNSLFILDVRAKERARKVHFAGSVNIPHYELEQFIHEIPHDKTIVIHCRFDNHGKIALDILRNALPEQTEIIVIRGPLPFE